MDWVSTLPYPVSDICGKVEGMRIILSRYRFLMNRLCRKSPHSDGGAGEIINVVGEIEIITSSHNMSVYR